MLSRRICLTNCYIAAWELLWPTDINNSQLYANLWTPGHNKVREKNMDRNVVMGDILSKEMPFDPQ